jgi:hypothetical protein
MVKLTVMSHIYNESYLLPFWLSHHKQFFDDGLIIDYCSTDNSIEIINKICPTWKVITTKNIINGKPNFGCIEVDKEIIEHEKNIDGYKITLNTTEFLFSRQDIHITKNNLCDEVYSMEPYTVTNNITTSDIYPKTIQELLDCIDYIDITKDRLYRGYRFLHNKESLNYDIGRHTVNESIYKVNKQNDFFIIYVRDLLININMINRRLQINNNVPERDRKWGAGFQHHINYEQLLQFHNDLIQITKPITTPEFKYVYDIIKNYNNYY